MHTGSGARVQRVVQKAMAGLPVTISVLGGSGEAPHDPAKEIQLMLER